MASFCTRIARPDTMRAAPKKLFNPKIFRSGALRFGRGKRAAPDGRMGSWAGMGSF
jgi:hypothetical protein